MKAGQAWLLLQERTFADLASPNVAAQYKGIAE